MANGWTPERRMRQAAIIRTWRPWEKSTGPRTPQGKSVVSRNAFQGGQRKLLRAIARALGVQRERLDHFQGRNE